MKLSVLAWIERFKIAEVLPCFDGESNDPLPLGWKPEAIWTWCDSYDEVGSYVIPGYFSKQDIDGERFVIGWFRGSLEADASISFIKTMDRRPCEDCDTEGCVECEELGWIETILLPEDVITVAG